jgi:hypothetical protein
LGFTLVANDEDLVVLLALDMALEVSKKLLDIGSHVFEIGRG